MLQGVVETEQLDIFDMHGDGFQVIELCNKFQLTTGTLDNFVDVSSVLITEFSGAVRHDASKNEISDLESALGLCFFEIFFLIDAVVVNANEVTYDISSVMGLASSRGRT